MPASEPISEFGLINWIRQRDRASPFRSPWTKLGIGDDCAILDVGPSTSLLVTTDMLMDGRHFRLKADGAERVGYKALGVNLSDIAALLCRKRARPKSHKASTREWRPWPSDSEST
jgi:thiamine-monophosphate kinase